MRPAERLEVLRNALPGCTVAVYADISAEMALAVAAEVRPVQERLDMLCAEAARLLSGPEAPEAVARLAPGGTELFLRSTVDPEDALCVLATPGADLDAALREGRALFAAFGGAA